MDGVSLPPDHERCRRTGTPNWRCPQRALPGKSHCLKHYLFYVSRRNRRKTTSDDRRKTTGRKTTSGEAEGGGGGGEGFSAVEPYLPVSDFDVVNRPVQGQTGGSGILNGGIGSFPGGGEIMGRFGGVGLWDGGITLGGPGEFRGSGVVNDHFALGGGRSLPKVELLPNLEGNGEEFRVIGGAPQQRVFTTTTFEMYPVLPTCGMQPPVLGGNGGEFRQIGGAQAAQQQAFITTPPKVCLALSGCGAQFGGVQQEFTTTTTPGVYPALAECGSAQKVFDDIKLMGKFVNLDKIELEKPKRGRPKGSKNKKKGDDDINKRVEISVGGIDLNRDDQSIQNPPSIFDHDDVGRKNLRWIMRDRQVSDSDSEKDDDNDNDDDDEGFKDKDDELTTIFNGSNYSLLPKKRGRPKGSKNKLKIDS